MDVACVLDCRSLLGEGPFWDVAEQRLYWVDIKSRRIHRFSPDTGVDEMWPTPEDVGSLAPREKGGLVIALKSGFHFYDPVQGRLVPVALPEGEPGHNRFNDGKTDRQGRFWAGKMGSRPTNSLFRLDADHSIQRMESGIEVSNGLGWSPDNRTFYYTDSPVKVIYAYDFDPAAGSIRNRRVFARVPAAASEGFPDGLAVDEEGCVWSARWGGWKVVRYRPDGSIDREIPMPVEFPTSCAFGGPELKDLYITSAWVEVAPDRRAQQPLAGDLFCLKTEVRGFPEPLYLG